MTLRLTKKQALRLQRGDMQVLKDASGRAQGSGRRPYRDTADVLALRLDPPPLSVAAFLLAATNGTLTRDTAVREWHFARDINGILLPGCRDWRFDFAFPLVAIAVEVDGGRWTAGGGRHMTPGDYQKLNMAVKLNWRVLRYLSDTVTADPFGVADDLMSYVRGTVPARPIVWKD